MQEIVSRNPLNGLYRQPCPLDEPIPQGEAVTANQEILFQIVDLPGNFPVLRPRREAVIRPEENPVRKIQEKLTPRLRL